MRQRCAVLALVLALVLARGSDGDGLHWQPLPELPETLGVASPFVGVHRGALVVAGGANFPAPVWEHTKVWHDAVHVLPSACAHTAPPWVDAVPLPQPRAYGASVSSRFGVVCIGGNDASTTHATVHLLKWNPAQHNLRLSELPDLPAPTAFAGAAIANEVVYVAGGMPTGELRSARNSFWALDLKHLGKPDFGWQELPPIPGPPRALPVVAAIESRESPRIVVMSGRYEGDAGTTHFLSDVYIYTVGRREPWRRGAELPRCVMGAPAIGHAERYVYVFGGDDGSLFTQADTLRDAHPGFSREVLRYDVQQDRWDRVDEMPAAPVTTNAVRWGTGDEAPVIIASGELRPRVRTPKVWAVTLPKED